MRTGAGLRNAVLVLLLVIAAHVVIIKAPAGAGGQQAPRPSAEPKRPGSTPLSDIRRARAGAARQEPNRGFLESWPPGPGELARDMFEQPRQRPYTAEDEERAALHRLVFSQPDDGRDYVEESKPKLMPDHSGLHMAAEGSITGDLPMFYIRPDAKSEGMSDYVSGIESWGAGYLPVMP